MGLEVSLTKEKKMYILTKESDMDCEDAFDLESMDVDSEMLEMIEEAITMEEGE